MEKKIGIFDSGVGGLTVLNSLYLKNNNTSYVYIADQIHLPYGNKSPKEIINFTNVLTDTLQLKYNVDSIISACHTSSVIAVSNLKKSIKITGINEALNLCLKSIKTKNVSGLILTTPATHKHDFYNKNYFKKHEINGFWETYPCDNFVQIVEDKNFSNLSIDEKIKLIKPIINDCISKEITHVILGCTHYPFLRDVVEKIFQKDIIVLDPSEFIQNKFHSEKSPKIELITTGNLDDFKFSVFNLFKEKPLWLLNSSFSKISWDEICSNDKQSIFY